MNRSKLGTGEDEQSSIAAAKSARVGAVSGGSLAIFIAR
jgi:hypothetical protein